MFSSVIVWYKLIYTALIILVKIIYRVSLICFNDVSSTNSVLKKLWLLSNKKDKTHSSEVKTEKINIQDKLIQNLNLHLNTQLSAVINNVSSSKLMTENLYTINNLCKCTATFKLWSIYLTIMLESVMILCSEISFLISSLAESSDVFSFSTDSKSSEIFLVIT